jgi:hypothetical protein
VSDPAKDLSLLLAITELPGEVLVLLGDEPAEDGTVRYRTSTAQAGVAQTFRDQVLELITRSREENEESPITLLPYEPTHRPERAANELCFVSASDDSYMGVVLRKFPKSPGTLDPFERQTLDEEGLPYSFVLVTELPGGHVLRLFRKVNPQYQFSERGKYLASLFGHEFKAVRGAPFVFDFSFSCVQFDDTLFILAYGAFESLFAIRATLLQTAERVVPLVGSVLHKDSFAPFQKAVSGSGFALRRLPAIEKVLEKNPSMDRFSRTIKEWSLKTVHIEGSGGSRRIAYDGKHIRELVKLLSEDYMPGPLTGNRYDSNSKRIHKT